MFLTKVKFMKHKTSISCGGVDDILKEANFHIFLVILMLILVEEKAK